MFLFQYLVQAGIFLRFRSSCQSSSSCPRLTLASAWSRCRWRYWPRHSGCPSSQLGAVTVSSVPDSESATVGGLQNTSPNLGASLGTALVGSMLIATMTTIVLTGIITNPCVPQNVKVQAELTFGPDVPFVSDTALSQALAAAGVSRANTQAILDLNAEARLDELAGGAVLVVLAAMIALFFTGWIPKRQPSGDAPGDELLEEDARETRDDDLIPAPSPS